MPRRLRQAVGGLVYHVINRGVGRMTLFEDDADYAAFERVMCQAQQRTPMRLLGYCLMPNHWHLVLWPRQDGELSEWMRWLTVTHTQRWHAHHHSSGTGPVYQGRFKSFPIQADEHLLRVLRYVERNAARVKLVNPRKQRAEDWRWGSLWRWVNRRKKLEEVPALCDWPVEGGTRGGAALCPGLGGGRPRNWVQRVNRSETAAELEAIRLCVNRGRPYGEARWVERVVKKLELESTLRGRGRPRKGRPHARQDDC